MSNLLETINGGRKEPEVRISKGAVVRTFSMQVLINCTCGVTEPILIHFIPGTNLKGLCPGCRSQFSLGKFVFDRSVSDNVQVGVGMIPPNIITPVGG